MTRIISGRFGGRRLEVPGGSDTRPTSDRVREALFGRLDHLDVLAGARVLDLYAGSGALGLEAVSRGAAGGLLVDSSRLAAQAANANVAALKVGGEVTVRTEPVEKVLTQGPGGVAYDLVFCDPPYPLTEEQLATVLSLLVERAWLSDEAFLVIERSSRSPEPVWPVGIVSAGERRYGETKIWCAEAGEADVA